MFVNKCPKSPGKKVSFSDEPCLINRQYKYQSLGELVSSMHKTGEFPAVGMRNGVYIAQSLDDDPPPRETFDLVDAMRSNMDATATEEAKLRKANEDKAKAESDKRKAELAELESLRKFRDENTPPKP